MNATLPCAITIGLVLTVVTGVSAQAQNPTGVNPQHFQCYSASDPTPPRQRKVELQDQFGRSAPVIQNPVLLCNPVSKNREATRDTTTHLVCYQVMNQQASRREVTVSNQFGVDTLRVDAARLLCVPSTKAMQRRCPDLTFGQVYPPSINAAQHTVVRFAVTNVGNTGAGSFAARVEDPSRAPNPDRIAETTLSGLGAGGNVVVTLELPYAVSTANFAALTLQIDGKNLIPECREDNNVRTVGAP